MFLVGLLFCVGAVTTAATLPESSCGFVDPLARCLSNYEYCSAAGNTVISAPLPNSLLFGDIPFQRVILLFANSTFSDAEDSGSSVWTSIQDIPVSSVTSAHGKCPSTVVNRLLAFSNSNLKERPARAVERNNNTEDDHKETTSEGSVKRVAEEDRIVGEIVEELLVAREVPTVSFAASETSYMAELRTRGDDVVVVVPSDLVTAQSTGHSRHTWVLRHNVYPRGKNNVFLVLDF